MLSDIPIIAFIGTFKGQSANLLVRFVKTLGVSATYAGDEAEKKDDWSLLVAATRPRRTLIEKAEEKGITVVGESWILGVQAEQKLLPYEDYIYQPEASKESKTDEGTSLARELNKAAKGKERAELPPDEENETYEDTCLREGLKKAVRFPELTPESETNEDTSSGRELNKAAKGKEREELPPNEENETDEGNETGEDTCSRGSEKAIKKETIDKSGIEIQSPPASRELTATSLWSPYNVLRSGLSRIVGSTAKLDDAPPLAEEQDTRPDP